MGDWRKYDSQQGNPNQGNPQQGYPPNQTNLQQGYPQQGYPPNPTNPQQGYPNQGYPPNQQGYPQQQHYPNQGYSNQQQGYPSQGYSPQKPGYPDQGHSPQQQGYPNQGYDQQQGYSNQGYPSNQKGYSNQGYAPNQAYPSQQSQMSDLNYPFSGFGSQQGQMSYNQPQSAQPHCGTNIGFTSNHAPLQSGGYPKEYSNPQSQFSGYPQGPPTAPLMQGNLSYQNHQNFQNEGPKSRPTVCPYDSFSDETDAKSLRNAMKGIGTTESIIVDITGNRNNAQRIKIREAFLRVCGRDLIKDLDSELSGSFRHLVLGCYRTPIEFDAESLNWAIRGGGTNEEMLSMLMVSRSSNEMQQLKNLYLKKYNRSVEADISNDTSGHYQRMLLELAKCTRQSSPTVDINIAQADANELYSAGVARWGTNERVFHSIFANRSFPQLKQTFTEYAKITGHSIDHAITKEMSGDVKNLYKTIIDYTICKTTFYAHLLHKSMKGIGTNDHLLCYIVISRSEIDLGDINENYLNRYRKPLAKMIKEDTSSDYKKLLLLLVNDH